MRRTRQRRSSRRRAVPTFRVLPAALVLTLALLLSLTPAVVPTAAAQDVRLPGLQGGQLSDADLAQGATIVVVWASWSPKCRDIVQRVNQIDRRWGDRARVVAVNFQEDRPTVRDFLSGQSMSAPVFLDLDGSFSKKNSVTTLPGLLVVRDGSVAYRGRLPDDPGRVIAEILG